MQATSQKNTESWATRHVMSPNDAAAMIEMRKLIEPNKGKMRGIGARVPYDAIMGRVAVPEGILFREDTVGGIPGWWCEPKGARPHAAILHAHGGWFNWGSAQAFRHLVGHIAKSANANAFVPDYRLAPEHPFPSALDDIKACYSGLIDRGVHSLALTGDSAGGNLILVVLAHLVVKQASRRPVAGVALSPVTDLTMSGNSWQSRASADPFFVHDQAEELIRSYLGDHEPADTTASPLFADLKGFPPIRIHVGEDEVLLDDSRHFVDRAVGAGVDAKLDVWEGMAHGFLGGIGRMDAADNALSAIGAFLSTQLISARTV